MKEETRLFSIKLNSFWDFKREFYSNEEVLNKNFEVILELLPNELGASK